MNKKIAALIVFLIALTAIFWISAFYIRASSVVVILDKERLIATFVGQLSAHNVSDRLLRLKTDAFRDALTKSVTFYAQKNNALVLDKKQALAGGMDITTLIEQDVSLRMRGMK